MTALKIHRFTLAEIECVTIRCRRCGAGQIVKVDSERFGCHACPSCGAPYGQLAKDVFELFQQTYEASRIAGESFDIEFDIVEK
jgi:hypothetical protein